MNEADTLRELTEQNEILKTKNKMLQKDNEKLKEDNEMLMQVIVQMKITLNRLLNRYVISHTAEKS